MPRERIKIEGQKFGELTILEYVGYLGKDTAYLCKCSCGVTKVMRAAHIRTGKVVSCGHVRKKNFSVNKNTGSKKSVNGDQPKYVMPKITGAKKIAICGVWK